MPNDNYPDDIMATKNIPGNPFYDDAGREAWEEERGAELLGDCMDEIEIELEDLMAAIISAYDLTEDELKLSHPERLDIMEAQMFERIGNVIDTAVENQLEAEWENRE